MRAAVERSGSKRLIISGRIAAVLVAAFLFAGACRALVDLAVRSPGAKIKKLHLRVAALDPMFATRAGSECLINSDNPQDCISHLENALRGNRRSRNTRSQLAGLAELRGDLASAKLLHRESIANDRTFQPLWSYWNFALRHADHAEFDRLTPLIVRAAPPGLQSHFALHSSSGFGVQHMLAVVESVGSPAKLADFLDYLASERASGAGEIILRKLDESSDPRIGKAALRFVQTCVRERDDFGAASRVWRKLLSHGLLAEKRYDLRTDAVLNPNPRIVFPLLAHTPDWSAIQNESASTSALSSEGGVRIKFLNPETREAPLLSKLIVFDADVRRIRIVSSIEARWPESLDPSAVAGPALFWQVRNAADDSLLAESPARTCGSLSPGCKDSLEIPWHERSLAVYLILQFRRSQFLGRTPIELRIYEVNFEELLAR